MRLIPRTIAGKLVFYLGLTNCVVLAATVWSGYVRARQMLVAQIDSAALKQVQTAAARLDDFLLKAATRGEMIPSRQLSILATAATNSSAVGGSASLRSGLLPLLVRMLKDAPEDEAYGSWFCRAEGAQAWTPERLFSPPIATPTRTEPSSHLTIWPRFPTRSGTAAPKSSGKPYITEPYYDDGGGNTSMVSLSHPCFDERDGSSQCREWMWSWPTFIGLISEIQGAMTRAKRRVRLSDLRIRPDHHSP